MFDAMFKSKSAPENPDFDDADIALATDLSLREADLITTHKLMQTITVMAIALVLATCFAIVMLTAPVKIRSYTVTIGGDAQQVVAISHPIDQTLTVEMWLESAISQAYTYNFANYQQQFAKSSKNFTTQGWNNWYKSLQASGGLDSVVNAKLSVSAIALARPLLQEYPRVIDGVYTWVFQVPVTISYQELNTIQSQSAIYRVYVVRVPVSQNPSGLAIEAIQTISTNIGS